MYTNKIIQTNYKPYIPPPKKKVENDNEENKQPETKGRVISPNDYNQGREQQKPSSDSFNKQQITPTKINISQLLIDFNSTLNAIGASEDVENEVKTYLNLVETQANKENPNKKIIVSNLKIAADVLDTYISDTLNKPSKVVKDWVEALLLQNIDFKANKSLTKGAFESITGEAPQTAKLAEKKLAEKAHKELGEIEDSTLEINSDKTDEIQQENITNDDILILISKSDEQKTPKETLSILSEAFVKAQEKEDKASMAKIYSKIAKVQNDLNNIPQALDCLNASTKLAYLVGDNKLKTHNHKQMGHIYDEIGYIDTAIFHFNASLAIDGVLDDTDNQADTLNAIGKMYTIRFEKDNAIEYYKDALELAKVKSNISLMGNIFRNTANTFENAGENNKALQNYKNAATLSQKAGDSAHLSSVYEEAGDLMLKMNCRNRAVDLYKKSYRLAEKNNLEEDVFRIKEKIISIVR